GNAKIAANGNPRPLDRVFVTYNYYHSAFESLNPPDFPRMNLHREVIGFEKTFLGGDASIGVRLPFVQLTGGSDVEDSRIEDVSAILKYAWINDRSTGDVFATGLVVTAPTGKDVISIFGTPIHSTLIQPWAGYIVNINRDWYLHGFLALIVPT